ncbi:MAG: gliding motility-associated C-terminal domain-containing protein [Crocinitomicaceae bacterium]|nr:gliding motility-associated C-terminal domain-containing protein [Crocinitomicaceae bacterium]MDG1776987.1 gliding motility-associated C-terminal domain-containing protein [Crocinitomicaceae bacterium]
MVKTGVIFLFFVLASVGFGRAQALYNDCSTALEICPNTVVSLNNIGANSTFCPGCEDDFNFCFTAQNTVWFTFKTNATGGDVTVNFNNLNFVLNPNQDTEIQALILEASVPCNSASYIQVSNCVSNGASPFSLNALGLAPNTSYYIVVNGDQTGPGITTAAECSFDLYLTGAGVDRPTPTIGVTPSSIAICLNDIVSFEALLTDCPNASTYNWFINSELVAVTDINVFSTSELIDGDILTVSTNCFTDCSVLVTTDSPSIDVYSFMVDAGADQSSTPGAAVTLNGITSAPTHHWEPSFLFSNPLVLNALVFPEETTTITLTATENGCTLSDHITVTISKELFIPTMFSPNGDGVNERWLIEGIEEYPNNSIHIYDRWGQEVFQSRSYSTTKAWDGTVKSGVVTEGVFFYVLELNDSKNKQYKGSITVIR